MGKYFRLIRLQDEHFQFGFALASGVFLSGEVFWVVKWAVATTLISFAAFISNEMADREDVDKFSWNKVHLLKTDVVDPIRVALLWWVSALSGLLLASNLGVFWPAVAMLLIGTAYSMKPIRLKGRVMVDILAQLAVWFWIPFMVPIFYFARADASFWSFVSVISLVAWGFFYPYQPADFTADKKAGLAGTHVVLGFSLSLFLGLLALVLGIAGYFILGVFQSQSWSVVFVLMGLVLFFHYLYWFALAHSRRERAMQEAAAYVKPVSWLLVPYIIFWLIR